MNLHINSQFSSSRREQVAQIIRDSILSGSLQPGDRIKEAEIANEIGVSRGPIREAIRQLEEEGFVISFPYKGTIVAELSDEEVIDVYIPIRISLESYAVKKACQNATEKDIDQLQQFVTRMITASKENQVSEIVEYNLLFHKYLISCSGTKSLEQVWNSIMNRIRLHFYKLGMDSNIDPVLHSQEHQDILDAIKQKDTKKAVALIEGHIR
ncbi:GntR family transcriptional regulator [Halalkalibacter oceani]|uniref:GntR family transcriptional regulator n=1 Tax=Halalkalibacter oceani TaxID=1653776 RepID=A0A9X2DT33_9BACI|nr:GntR family transcriptional regulator [Halalkalibacter oceani]MCM3714778.1 GntR family transcriptional regulator [Halalkalibacter oceani]